MDFTQILSNIGDFAKEWGTVAGVALTSISLAVGAIVFAWVKIKPFFEMLTTIKDKLFNKAVEEKENVLNELQLIEIDTKIADCRNKIDSPSNVVSDEMKQVYISNLAKLEVIKAKFEAGLVVVEEKTGSF